MTYRMKFIGSLLMLVAAVASAQQQSQTLLPQNFFDNFVEVKGLGFPGTNVQPNTPLAYGQAERAAVVDANRNLAEMATSIQIDSQSVNEMRVLVQDTVKTSVQARIKGGQIVRETSMAEFLGNDLDKRGKVEVVMRVPLNGSGGLLNAIMPTLAPEIVKRLDEAKLPVYTQPPAPPTAAANTPAVAATVDYDGLIVRVPSDFKPALSPKIFTEKGEVLYSAKDVAMDILISRGAAQYTNNEGKAKAVLEGMGCKSILNLEGGLRTDTDAEIKNDDASKIFNANKKTSFLNKGRVVFLVARPS